MNSKTKIFIVGTLTIMLGLSVFYTAVIAKDPVKVTKKATECCKSKPSEKSTGQTAAKSKDCSHNELRCCGSTTTCGKVETDKCCKIGEESKQKVNAKSCCKKK